MIEITKDIFIPENELVFKTSRSSGPGGQNVNKVNTRVTLLFDIYRSEGLSDTQKQRILARLKSRTDRNGVIRIVSQKHRTQSANRRATIERLGRLLADALKTKPVRKKTLAPYSAKQKRLQDKKKRSLLKQLRASRNSAEDY